MGESEEEAALRALGLDKNCDAIVNALAKQMQFVSESAELYATDYNEEEEEREEVEDED